MGYCLFIIPWPVGGTITVSYIANTLFGIGLGVRQGRITLGSKPWQKTRQWSQRNSFDDI